MKILALLVLLASSALAVDLKTLTPWEAARWEKAKGDPKLAASFHATRDYARFAKSVVDGKASSLDLKKPKNFDARFLAKGEVGVINKAIDKGLDDLAEDLVKNESGAPHGSIDAKDMTPWEAARWAEVRSDPKAAESFQATRDYVRQAKRVLAGKMKAVDLKKPANVDGKHFEKGDVDTINKAIDKGLDELAAPSKP